ncbi:beta-ketoacyl synthase N-terminal-like domain-containing protein [Micromonospora sp. NPDC049044]|uniref:beta-ketoacyl synthase N-terminal-like domain-containing protein n=1 Tax=Micromonospora sp. NPDC049044 TaxID=3154827 RepID=UPI0033E20D77
MFTTAPCIVGWSALSPWGVGRESFVEGFRSDRPGRSGPVVGDGGPPPGYLIDADNLAGLVRGKGTRTLDRMTMMVLATSTMLLDEQPAAAVPDTGLVLGTSAGSIDSITTFLRDTFVQDKPYFVNPAHFPNTVMNGAAGRTAIWHSLRGLNSTISAGHSTGIAALRYASRMIRRGYAERLLVGAVEELSPPIAWAAHHMRSAAGPAGERVPMGEGCVLFLVERARAEGSQTAPPVARLAGFQAGTAPLADGAQALAEAIGTLLRRAGVDPADLWAVSLGQSGDGDADRAESLAVERALGSARPLLLTPSRKIGNSFSALGAFQVATLLAAAHGDRKLGRPALVTSMGVDGAVSCALVIV